MPARDGEEPLPPLRAVIARHGLSARRSLGQNFLLDLNLTGRIVREARAFLGPRDGDLTQGTVIEIGPGPGGLTRALLDQGTRHLVAIETDRRCLAALAELESAYPGRLELTEGDATRLPVASLGEAPRRIVANLPYNVATTLLLQWLTVLAADPRVLAGLVLLFQKEVAARLAAAPRSKDYGRLSVIAQWLCEIRLLFEIPARAFTPPPKVTSSLVGLRPRPAHLAPARLATLERVTAAAFGQRRKMLRQSLKSLGGAPELLLEATGLSGTARAEELSVEDFCALANALDERDTDATGHEN